MLGNSTTVIFLILFFKFGFIFSQEVEEETKLLNVNYKKSTIRTRFSPPKGFQWQKEEEGSFGDYLVKFPLYPENFPVRDFNQIPIEKQNNHAAILNIDVGDKNLQQCADAWIRLYAEYLWSKKDFDKIVFQFTSGQHLSWNDFKNGVRTTEVGDQVEFRKTAKPNDSYQNFRNYLNLVFQYAGTISLDRESFPVKTNQDIRVGDIIITPGSPGHCVIIVGIAKNSVGKKLYLLAESFMPAQDIHIIKNKRNNVQSPWYELDVNAKETVTAKYIFRPTSIKRFHALQ